MSERIDQLNQALADRYAIQREVGAGGMATVYLATDFKHDREVAVKVFHPEVASSVGAERFLREIQISARLNHPHILTLIDSGQADDVLYYVLPYVEGESLHERLEREGHLPLEEVVHFVEQIGSALDYAHEQGVIHRDIKPANILVHQGEAMVSDFGIAVGFAAAKEERLTATGTSLGTPAYMSPEQVEGEGLDERSDVYALGCLAYEMISGHLPFRGPSAQSVLAKILTADPEPLENVPPKVAEAIKRALARSPESRFATSGELARALRAEVAPAGAGDAESPGWKWATAAAAAVLVGLIGWQVLVPGGTDASVERALADIDRLVGQADWVGAYRAASALEGSVSDSTMERIWSDVALFDTLATDPAGATVSWRPYLEKEAEWVDLGQTPLTGHFPRTLISARLELTGYQSREVGVNAGLLGIVWPLLREGADDRVVAIPTRRSNLAASHSSLWQAGAEVVEAFLIDEFEVTNEEYAVFVADGGYERPEFWEDTFFDQGETLTFESAMPRMRDRTARPGPATWEVGTYLEGTANHPVTGVSWYEAAAYAKWAGRDLPSLYHWYAAARTDMAAWIIPGSNMNGTGSRATAESESITPSGVRDMAGNAREWVVNTDGELPMIVGGGWNDAAYYFGSTGAQPWFDRSETNGFRLITHSEAPERFAELSRPIGPGVRDFDAETPVSDDVFEVFRTLYAYDDTPLNAEVVRTDTVGAGVRQLIELDAAYGNERLSVYLFLPEEPSDLLQTVVMIPGSGVLTGGNIDWDYLSGRSSFAGWLTRSGRAVALPVYKSTLDREDDYVYARQDPSNDHRDHVIMWRQDLGRAMDYLETRSDIDAGAFSYFGHSWGGRMGVIMLAVEPRFKAGVLYVAGLSVRPTQPSVEPLNFAPRLEVPVLMLNGEHDHIYPLATAALPLYERVGSAIKEHFIAPGGHFVPQLDLIRESLAWLDEYVGPVR